MDIGAPNNHMKVDGEGKKTKYEKNMECYRKTKPIKTVLREDDGMSTGKEPTEKKHPEQQNQFAEPSFFRYSEEATKAAIRLALKAVSCHTSTRSLDDFPDLLKVMFPDSAIAQGMQIHRTKWSWVIL